MTFQQIWQLTRRWAWLLVASTLLAAVASYVVSMQLPKQYESSVMLLVRPGQASNGASNYNDVLAAERLTSTYSQVLKTQPVVDEASSRAGVGLPYEEAVKLLSVQPVRDTQLIQISVRAKSPDLSAAFANQLANTFIEQTQLSQSSRFAASRENLGKQVDQLAVEINTRSSQVDALRAQPSSAARDAELTRVEGQLTQLQQSYATAVRSFEDVRMAEANGSDVLSVVQPASPSSNPVSPRVLQNVLIAALVGLLVALITAFLIENLDDRLTSPERLARFSGLPLLGSLGILPKDEPRTIDLPSAHERQSPNNGYAASHTVEAFRLLHANLQFAALERPLRTLLVTSTDAGDGKTTVAANLAIVAAQAGQRVLLVDADLRRPAQHTTFDMPNRTGLTSLLVDPKLPLPSVVLVSRVEGLDLLLSGPLPPNPSELVASARMRARLGEFIDGYDLVVIDSPPTLAVSDPAVLAGQSDGTLVVVNSQKTHGHAASQAVVILRKAGAHVLGAVLNRLSRNTGSYYGYYTHAHEWRLSPATGNGAETATPKVQVEPADVGT